MPPNNKMTPKSAGVREVQFQESDGRAYVWCGGCEVAVLYIEFEEVPGGYHPQVKERILECECGQLGLVCGLSLEKQNMVVEWCGDVNNPPPQEKPKCGYRSPWTHPEDVPEDGYLWLNAHIDYVLGFRRRSPLRLRPCSELDNEGSNTHADDRRRDVHEG